MNNKWKNILYFLFMVMLITGCASQKADVVDTASEGQSSTFPVQLPATFVGKIACTECDYVNIDLNLRPDHLYQLRKTWYADNEVIKSEAQMRKWRFDDKENLIILGKGKGALKTYSIKNAETLNFLDLEGEVKSDLIQYELKKKETFDPFPDVIKMRGMYRSSGNTHVLKECSSGLDFLVDPSGKFTELDRAYRNTPHEKDRALLVSFQGKLLPTRKGRLLRDNDIMVVTGFNRLYPDQDCNGNILKNNLFGIHWAAVEIAGKRLDAKSKAPFFVLEAKGNKVKGYAGCNRFFGTFLFKGDVFIFNKLASTRMACPDSVSIENVFFAALDKTESHRIEKDILVLLDKNEEITMKLQEKK